MNWPFGDMTSLNKFRPCLSAESWAVGGLGRPVLTPQSARAVTS